jgi:Flp pilus assembly protein TadG
VTKQTKKGSSVVELAILMPWFVFLFVGILDMGFYNYALISAQSAARTAALYTSTSTVASTDATTACTYIIDQLTSNISLTSATTCDGTGPITLTATSQTGPDGNTSAKVTIQFNTPLLIPIPGILPANLTITRSVQMLRQ